MIVYRKFVQIAGSLGDTRTITSYSWNS